MPKRSRRVLNLLLLAFGTLAAFGQTQPAPAFEVATVKPTSPGARPAVVGVVVHPDSIQVIAQTLPELLRYAYGYKNIVFDGQITGLPDWASAQRYDIVAKMSAADAAIFQTLSKDEQESRREQMLRVLLAERFSLSLHRGSKQIPVYELVVAKGGTKMKDASTDPAPPQLAKDNQGKPTMDIRFLKDTSIVQAFSMRSLVDLTSMPQAQIDRPVVDKTGLTGTYNFTLNWSPFSARPPAPGATTGNAAAPDDSTAFFVALRELGLKLELATDPMETIIIDHAEKPTDN